MLPLGVLPCGCAAVLLCCRASVLLCCRASVLLCCLCCGLDLCGWGRIPMAAAFGWLPVQG